MGVPCGGVSKSTCFLFIIDVCNKKVHARMKRRVVLLGNLKQNWFGNIVRRIGSAKIWQHQINCKNKIFKVAAFTKNYTVSVWNLNCWNLNFSEIWTLVNLYFRHPYVSENQTLGSDFWHILKKVSDLCLRRS